MSINHVVLFLSKYSLRILLAWLAVYLLVSLLCGRPFQKRFLVLSAAAYAAVLLYMTLLSRGPQGERHYQLELFWEYRQAFRFETGRLRVQNAEYAWLIANNIFLFVPLGVLLSEGFQTYGKNTFFRVAAAGCLASAILEVSQLAFRMGLFELDDIFNNVIGAGLGFCCYGLVKCIKKIAACSRSYWEKQ